MLHKPDGIVRSAGVSFGLRSASTQRPYAWQYQPMAQSSDYPQAEKLVSRFARFRAEDARIDAMADEIEGMGDPESPSEMREKLREMGKAMDDDMGDEMEEMFEADMEGKLEDEE